MLAYLHDKGNCKTGLFTRSFDYFDDAGLDQNEKTPEIFGDLQEEKGDENIEFVSEDDKLIAEMKALGLPLAFGSQSVEKTEDDANSSSEKKRRRNNKSKDNSHTSPPQNSDLQLSSLSEEQQAELWSSWTLKCPQFSSEADKEAFLLSSIKGDVRKNNIANDEWMEHCVDYLLKVNKTDFISQRLQLLGYRFGIAKNSTDQYSLKLGRKLSKLKKSRAQLDVFRIPKIASFKSTEDDVDVVEKASNKYEAQKYRLFSRFDEGIRLDDESWFSVTPEKIAEHHARRCQTDIIVDAFCGAGGDAIQLAFTCELVIAVDIDPHKIELAKHNAEIYGVADRIEFVAADFFVIAPHLKADAVFLSPPWGGPQYSSLKRFDLFSMMPIDVNKMFEAARSISSEIAFFAPRNTDVMQLLSLAESPPDDEALVEIEQNFYDHKLKAITAYYGYFVNDRLAQKIVYLDKNDDKNE